MISFLRVIKFAFLDIGRNLSLSFMTVLILVLMMLSVNALLIVRYLTNQSITYVKEQIDVSVYFDPEAKDDKISEVKNYLQSFPEVTNIEYIDREMVLAGFREKHKDNKEILASLDELGTNPLGPTMIVKTREPEDYQKVINALSIPEYDHIIESKTFADTQKAIERIDTITSRVEELSFVLTVLFALIAFLVIFNTIRVAIFTQRMEISIKKLVGATNWFVRGPYIIEALIFSALAVVITYVIVFFCAKFLDQYLMVVFGPASTLSGYFQSNIIEIGLIQFAAVFFLTLFTSLLAMRKYLKV
jgi:cell division transport system permease protein